jgi:cytochrome P450
MVSITGVVAGSLVAIIVSRYLVYPWFLSPLSRIPNAHWSAPLSSAWIGRKRRLGLENRTIYSLHQRLGPVVRLGPNELSFNSIEALRIIYTGSFEKDEWYHQTLVNFETENLVSTLRLGPHAKRKRMLSNIYSKSYLQESPDLRTASSLILLERLLPLLDDAANAGKPVNVFPLFEAVGMDFTSAYLFGTNHGTNYIHDASSWAHWMESYDSFKIQSPKTRRGGFLESWCLSLCEKTAERLLPTTEKTRDDERKRSTYPVVYMALSRGLEKMGDSRPRQLAIASEMLDHLIAGHETSGITLTYLVWELSRRPKLQAALRQELLTLSPPISFPCPASRDPFLPVLPPAAEVTSLPLLDAVVRETLRLHAAAPGPQPRVVPLSPTPTKIEGYEVPAGVKVSSSAYTLHRNAEVYPQPLEWLPERWREVAPDKIRDMRRLFWAFGSGGRMCLGSNFALQGGFQPHFYTSSSMSVLRER